MHKIALMVLSLVLTLTLGAGLLPAQDGKKEPLTIGYGGALLGNRASYGLSGFYGLEYAVLKANAAGGVLGRRVEVVKEDDSCDPALASTAAAKLAGAGVRLVLGHSCSGATSSALSVYGQNVLLISPSATETNLTEDGGHPYFFRTIIRDDVQADLQVEFVKKRGFKKVAILHDKSDYGKGLADLAKAGLEKLGGVSVALFEGLTSGQLSYDAVLSRLEDSGAEVLLWGGYYSDAARLAAQMRSRQVNAIIVGADGLKNEQYVKMAGEAAEGTLATGPADLSKSSNPPAAVAEALADHQKRYPSEEVGPYFFYSAAAMEALFSAIEKAGSATDLDAIKKHLQEDSVETVMGPVRFDDRGDIIGSRAVMYEIKGGRFVEVEL
ncbi:MAG: branched-chain amino acid ABC transporter substrate-binding protein [Candidatus Adiutrix sp.]|jgi:branched-chain amino acid transport system substrate-binding protein|nr:branched-chain amino acid ABC transporter substrate-binding protein [Candidatus Adiutrix sp.]